MTHEEKVLSILFTPGSIIRDEQATMKGLLQDVQRRMGIKRLVSIRPDISFFAYAGTHTAGIGTEGGTRPPEIVYSPTILKTVGSFAVAGILAHELAHLHFGDTENTEVPSEQRRKQELRADQWATERGFGLNLIASFEWGQQEFVNTDPNEEGDEHPGMQTRIDAIRRTMEANTLKLAA